MRSMYVMMMASFIGGAVIVFSGSAGAVEPLKKSPFQNFRNVSHDQSVELSEPALLNRLDKSGRFLYYSLDGESKRYARELAAQSEQRGERRVKDFKKNVQTAALYMDMQRIRIQDRRLHNGMDRLLKNLTHDANSLRK